MASTGARGKRGQIPHLCISASLRLRGYTQLGNGGGAVIETRPRNPVAVIPIVAGIGNALMAQPMVRQLKRAWGDARIIVMARLGAMGEIFSRMNEVEQVRPLGKSSAEILKNMWKVRGMKPYLFIAPF